jgi:hypothetical protein
MSFPLLRLPWPHILLAGPCVDGVNIEAGRLGESLVLWAGQRSRVDGAMGSKGTNCGWPAPGARGAAGDGGGGSSQVMIR